MEKKWEEEWENKWAESSEMNEKDKRCMEWGEKKDGGGLILYQQSGSRVPRMLALICKMWTRRIKGYREVQRPRITSILGKTKQLEMRKQEAQAGLFHTMCHVNAYYLIETESVGVLWQRGREAEATATRCGHRKWGRASAHSAPHPINSLNGDYNRHLLNWIFN